MSQPIHTLGPVEATNPAAGCKNDGLCWQIVECRKNEIDARNIIASEMSADNARLLAAAYNAFDSAAKRLGVNAVEFAERMADEEIAKLVEAVRAAKQMSDWFMEHSSQADHAHSELKQPLHETSGWKELIESGYNGLMASYHQQFEEALAKVKGDATLPASS